MVQSIYLEDTGISIVLLLIIVFDLANNADLDEMMHHAAFHPGLHCFAKVAVLQFPINSGFKHSQHLLKIYNIILWLLNRIASLIRKVSN